MTRQERIEQAARALVDALWDGHPWRDPSLALRAALAAPTEEARPIPKCPHGAEAHYAGGCGRSCPVNGDLEHRAREESASATICNAESPVGHHCQKPPRHVMDHKDRHGNTWPREAGAPDSEDAFLDSMITSHNREALERALARKPAPEGTRCPGCSGSGVTNRHIPFPDPCPRCGGTGRSGEGA